MESKSLSSGKCSRPSVFLYVILLLLSRDNTKVEAVRVGICEVCSCQVVTSAQGPGGDMQIACDGMAGGEVPTLDDMKWESIQENSIKASFQYLDWKTIPK